MSVEESEIKIIEKPDSISWDRLHEVLWAAHEQNRKEGMVMKTSLLSGEELRDRISRNTISWKTYVLMDEDNVVGTGSISVRKKKAWYVDGKVAYYLCAGVLPDYAGKGLYKMLTWVREEYGKSEGCKLIYFDTPENNRKQLETYRRHGFRRVDFFASKSNHYSVVMAKWYDDCPFSEFYCRLRFLLKKVYVKCVYKPGKVRRLW